MVEGAHARKFSCVYVYQKRQQEKHRELNRKKELIGGVGIKERKKNKRGKGREVICQLRCLAPWNRK